jgi:hypothetical protein
MMGDGLVETKRWPRRLAVVEAGGLKRHTHVRNERIGCLLL